MRRLIIRLSLFLLFNVFLTQCCLALDPGLDEGLNLVITGVNNLFSFDTNFSELNKALSGVTQLPGEVFYRKQFFIALPLWQEENTAFGLTYRQTEQCWVNGDTLDFYHGMADKDYQPAKRHYDLRGDYLKYTQLGGYVTKRWDLDSFQTRIRGDLFICYDFFKLNLMGQGRIRFQPDGAQKYELYGDYQRDWCTDGTPPGWGYALSCDFFYQQSGFLLFLSLQNLFGGLFFRQLQHENNWINTDEPSIGPLPMKGFYANDSFYYTLPLATELQIAYFYEEGAKFYGEALFEGKSRKYTLGYRRSFGKIAMITAITPSCKSFDLGLAVDYGELILNFGWDITAIKGISFAVWI